MRSRTVQTPIESLERRAYLSASPGAAVTPQSAATPLVVQLEPRKDATAGALTPSLSGTLPKSVVAGQKIKPIVQRLKITNTSNATVTGTIAMALTLSHDQVPDQNDPVIGTASRSVNLKPGKSILSPLRLTSVPADASGSYYFIVAVADPQSQSSTAISKTTMNIEPPAVDLAGVFGPVPTTLHSGQKVTVKILMSNVGNIPASGPLKINMVASPDGNPQSTQNVPLATLTENILLKPRQKRQLHFTGTLPTLAPGNYTLIALADPQNTFKDANTANNLFSSHLIKVS